MWILVIFLSIFISIWHSKETLAQPVHGFSISHQGTGDSIHPSLLDRLQEIEQDPLKTVTWVNAYTVEIRNRLSGLVQQFDLRISEVHPDSIDQVIDVTSIDTSQFNGTYSLWQTIPIGSRFGNALVVSDFNANSRVELTGSYLQQIGDNIRVAVYEVDSDSVFYLRKMYVDSVQRVIGPFSTDLDHDELKELCLIDYRGHIKNKEALSLIGFPNRTNFVSSYKITGINIRFDDIDQDGYLDYIAIGSDSSISLPTYIAEYDPSVNNFILRYSFVPKPFTFIYNYSVGDVDGDGHKDCVGSSANGNIFIIENIANDQYSLVWTDSISNSNASLISVTNDIDGNGKSEFFIGATGYYQGLPGTELFWYEAVGDNQYEIERRIFLIGTDFFGANLLYNYDVDDDGKYELVFDFDSQLIILKANSQQTFDVYYFVRFPPEKTIKAITFEPQRLGQDMLISFEDTGNSPFYKTLYYKKEAATYIPNQHTQSIYHFRLYPVYPNPFNSSVTIAFSLSERQTISLLIYNILGREIIRLIDTQIYFPGQYKVVWNGQTSTGKEVSNGIYFCVLKSARLSVTRKLLFIR